MILLHDGPCIVIDKPAGLLTQAPPGIDSAEVRVRAYIREREQIQHNFYLGLPHRLDRPVSGALIFARHARAAKRLSQQFERRDVKKIYWAVVSGAVAPAAGTWEDFLIKLPHQAHVHLASADTTGAQLARLHYRVVQSGNSASWLEIELETGRMHQIRVQLAARGHAVWGDLQYGSPQAFGPIVADDRQRWIALRSRRLVFRHPMEDRTVDVTAPIPWHWLQINEFDFSSAMPAAGE